MIFFVFNRWAARCRCWHRHLWGCSSLWRRVFIIDFRWGRCFFWRKCNHRHFRGGYSWMCPSAVVSSTCTLCRTRFDLDLVVRWSSRCGQSFWCAPASLFLNNNKTRMTGRKRNAPLVPYPPCPWGSPNQLVIKKKKKNPSKVMLCWIPFPFLDIWPRKLWITLKHNLVNFPVADDIDAIHTDCFNKYNNIDYVLCVMNGSVCILD